MGSAVFFRTLAITVSLVATAACGNGAGVASANDASTSANDAAAASSPSSTSTASSTAPPPASETSPRGNAVGHPGAAPVTYANIVTQASFSTLYAISDVHGHAAELETLLVAAGLVSSTSNFPTSVVWTGGNATLVVAGDMIDKGPSSLEVIELSMALISAVKSQGIGTVIVLLGNHEAEFLAAPNGRKFSGKDRIDDELAAQKPPISPSDFAAGKDPRGAFLLKLPFAAKIGGYFISHSGNANGDTLATLDSQLSIALASKDSWSSDTIIGANSIVEADDWYTSEAVVSADAAALSATHIVFGHDPNAFSSTGVILQPTTFNKVLVKLDAGLGAGYSNGAMYRVRHVGTTEVPEVILPNGTVTPL